LCHELVAVVEQMGGWIITNVKAIKLLFEEDPKAVTLKLVEDGKEI